MAWCSPSRTALLTSRRPDTSRTWSVVPTEYWRDRGGNFSTLPQYFKERGYLTLGLGKIFHGGGASGHNDVAFSWSPESLPYSSTGSSADCTPRPLRLPESEPRPRTGATGGSAMTPSPVAMDDSMPCTANRTLHSIAKGRAEASDKRPFFYAVGFHRPHIPWNVPQKYYDMYPLDAIELAAHRSPPVGVPPVAMNNILSGYWANAFATLVHCVQTVLSPLRRRPTTPRSTRTGRGGLVKHIGLP